MITLFFIFQPQQNILWTTVFQIPARMMAAAFQLMMVSNVCADQVTKEKLVKVITLPTYSTDTLVV